MTTATLQRSTSVVIWNASGSGALIETALPLSVGTVGVLEVEVDGETRCEWFRVCRVHRTVAGASSVVAVEFLPLAVSTRPALRDAFVEGIGSPARGMDAISGGSSGDTGNTAAEAPAGDGTRSPKGAGIAGKVVRFPSKEGGRDVGSAVARPQGQAHYARVDREEGDKHMMTFVSRLVRDDEGQDLIEYVLIGSFVSIGALAGATALGVELNDWYQAVGTWAEGAASGIAGS